jgi:class 3 adenylate cyclase
MPASMRTLEWAEPGHRFPSSSPYLLPRLLSLVSVPPYSHGIEVQSRVGVNSGEVVVRAIGNDLRMDYSAIDQTTHLAARMEQLAPPGSIRLSAATLKLAEGLVQVKTLGPTAVKGLAHRVDTHGQDLLYTGGELRRLT